MRVSAVVLMIAVTAHADAAAPEGEISFAVQPDTGVACLWEPRGGEPICHDFEAGLLSLRAPDSALIELSSPGFFSLTARADELQGFEAIALDALPTIEWSGWVGDPPLLTRVEWLEKGNKAEWKLVAPQEHARSFTLPGEWRALRFSPIAPAAASRTVFAEDPRESIKLEQSLALETGQEIAFCLELGGEPVGDYLVTLRPEMPPGSPDLGRALRARTGSHGCARLVSEREGVLVLTDPQGSFSERPLKIGHEGFLWVGIVETTPPPTISVTVEDADADALYTLELKGIYDGSSATLRHALLKAGSGREVVWSLPPGLYRIVATTESLGGARLTRLVDVRPGDERAVVLHANRVELSGTVTRGSEPVVGIGLGFEQHIDGTELRAETYTAEDGAYRVILPAPGEWKVVVRSEKVRTWRGGRLSLSVPPVAWHSSDIELPANRVTGRVVSAVSEEPVAALSLTLYWSDSDDVSGMSATTTDKDGHFAIEGLPQEGSGKLEALELDVRSRGFRQPEALTFQLGREQHLELRLQPGDSQSILEVRDYNGRPVPQVTVMSVDSPSARMFGVTDGEGRWRVPDDLSLPLDVGLVSAGRPWKIFRIEPGVEMTPAILPSRHEETAEILFSAENGEVPMEMLWGLVDEQGRYVPLFFHLLAQGTAPVALQGRARLPLAAPGSFTIWVMRDGRPKTGPTVVFPRVGLVVCVLP